MIQAGQYFSAALTTWSTPLIDPHPQPKEKEEEQITFKTVSLPNDKAVEPLVEIQEDVNAILAAPPFHTVDGVINFRDYGLSASIASSSFSTSSTSTSPSLSSPSSTSTPTPTSPSTSGNGNTTPRIRERVLFRSGELARLTRKGVEELSALGVHTVFDLRSASEVAKYDSATPAIFLTLSNDKNATNGFAESSEGVKKKQSIKDLIRFVRAPVSDGDEYDPSSLALKLAFFEKEEKRAFRELYSNILENGGSALEIILTHLRDNPGEGCLIHCTYGKDRTGIMVTLILLILGIPEEAIAHDYGLTTYGLEPAMPHLAARLQKDKMFRDNWKGFQNMGSAREINLLTALEIIRTKYGGIEGYVRQKTSLNDTDLERIRYNLLIK